MSPTEEAGGDKGGCGAGEPPPPPVYCRNPRRLVWVPILRAFARNSEARLPGVSFRGSSMARPVRAGLHLSRAPPPRWVICSLRPAGSTPCLPFGGLRALSLSKRLSTRLAATQLARSSVLNRLSAPAGLAPALMCALRAHEFRSTLRGFDARRPRAAPRVLQ